MITHPKFRTEIYSASKAKDSAKFISDVEEPLKKNHIELSKFEMKYLHAILKEIDISNLKVNELDDTFLHKFKQYIYKIGREFDPDLLDDFVKDFKS
jgi:hypothetical protein